MTNIQAFLQAYCRQAGIEYRPLNDTEIQGPDGERLTLNLFGDVINAATGDVVAADTGNHDITDTYHRPHW